MSPAIATAQHLLHATDSALTNLYLSLFRERGGLLAFMFHSVFRTQAEIELGHVAPMDRITVAFLRQFIEYYLAHDYRFVSPADLLTGLDPGRRHAMLTFDDGYFSNTLALPLLEQYKVPALFCIATDNVQDNRCFWWDVYYREHEAQGTPRPRFDHGIAELKSLPSEEIEARLTAQFGPAAFTPRSDIDRPFSPSELRDFARSPYVHLGNHTAHHAILTNYTPEQAGGQIQRAQDFLHEMTGVRPLAVAYPNGAYNARILEICRQAGLKVGFTVRPAKNHLPLEPDSPRLLRLARFCPRGKAPIATQCRTYRSDVQLYGLLRAGYLRLSGAQAD